MKGALFVRFLGGRFLALLGDQFLLFAVPLLTYQVTGSVARSGLMFFIEWTPRILSLPFAGVFADRFGGRRIYLTSDLGRAVACVLAFGAMRARPDATFVVLAVVVSLSAWFNSQAFVALESTLPRLVSPAELPAAQATLQGTDQSSQILGPAAATVCAALLSKQALFLLVGLAFLLSFVNLLTLRGLDLGPSSAHRRSLVADLGTGVSTLIAHRSLFRVIALTFLANLMIGTTFATSAAITTGVFARSDRMFGVVNTITGCVAVTTFLLVPRLLRRFSILRLGIASFLLMMGGALLAGLSPSYQGFAVGCVVLLSSVGVFNVFLRTERARIIPREHLGKTMGIVVLLNNCSLPLSGLLLGTGVAESLGPQRLIFLVAAAASAPAALLLPRLVRQEIHANPRCS
jgi:MFS family permease